MKKILVSINYKKKLKAFQNVLTNSEHNKALKKIQNSFKGTASRMIER